MSGQDNAWGFTCTLGCIFSDDIYDRSTVYMALEGSDGRINVGLDNFVSIIHTV